MAWKSRRKPLYRVFEDECREMQKNKESFRAIELLFISAVFVQDPEAIKNIMTKQFSHFVDRGLYVNHRDPLLCHLARLEHKYWKPLRRKFGPAFTPTNTKYMFPLLLSVCGQLVDKLNEATTSGSQTLEMFDICSRFSIDVIANIAFGLESNSLKERESEFKFFGQKATKEHFRYIFQFNTKYINIMQLFNIKYHSQETTNFFTNLVKETLEYREKHNIRRSDFIDILIQLKNDPKVVEECAFTLEQIVGQAFLFFAAGYNSSSTALCEALYEMARHPEIQEKARHEVLQVLERNNGELNYESTKQLKYIKQIILGKYCVCVCSRKKYTLKTIYSYFQKLYVVIPWCS